jgi:hypothetical protein
MLHLDGGSVNIRTQERRVVKTIKCAKLNFGQLEKDHLHIIV